MSYQANFSGFSNFQLDPDHSLWIGRLPNELIVNQNEFKSLWEMHPEKFHQIQMLGKSILTPRWQQAYGIDYQYTGQTNRALEIPSLLEPFLNWSQNTIDSRLIGLLLNWYDGKLNHYIGKHRDSTANMIEGSPIVTISFGEERIFRLRPWKGKEFIDFPTADGCVFIMPSNDFLLLLVMGCI